MKKYRIVGWYSHDGSDPLIPPFARVAEVEAASSDDAYRKGGAALNLLYEKEGLSVDFLNWFVKERP
jgi:hypothetical protein